MAQVKLTDEQIAAIERLLAQGESVRAIAAYIGVGKSTVARQKKASVPADADTNQQDNSTPILTAKQKKILAQLSCESPQIVDDPVEGWFRSVGKAKLRAAGSVLWWNCIVYPESAPPNWIAMLARKGYQFEFILHDKDKWDHDSPAGKGYVNGELVDLPQGAAYKTGDLKKPHYHVQGRVDHARQLWQISDEIQSITNGTCCQATTSPMGYHAYMTHKGVPDKYPYWKEDEPTAVNGYCPELNTSERKAVAMQISHKIIHEHISNYEDLIDLYDASPEEQAVIISHSGHYRALVEAEWARQHPDVAEKSLRMKNSQSLEMIAMSLAKDKHEEGKN